MPSDAGSPGSGSSNSGIPLSVGLTGVDIRPDRVSPKMANLKL